MKNANDTNIRIRSEFENSAIDLQNIMYITELSIQRLFMNSISLVLLCNDNYYVASI